jgi:sugar phosphate isomerase/epimerase
MMTAKFTLSLAHATLLDLSPPDLIRVAAAAGYEAAGLRLIPMGRPGEPRHALAEHPNHLRETRRALAETGVRLWDIEVAQILEGVNPRSYLPDLEAAAELGARFVLTNVYTPNHASAVDGFGALCDLARPLGLSIALEFVSFSDASTLTQAVSVLRSARRDNAGVLIDTLHWHSSQRPLSDLTAVPPDRVHYVHVSDGPRDVPAAPAELRRIAREERLLPGEGGIDVAGILRHLPANIVYAVEAPNPARAAALGADGYARLAFDTTMAYLQAHVAAGPLGRR